MDETPSSPGKARTFGSFSLDSDRGCLLVDGIEVPLRPKTFALLSYLVDHPGRLVSKDELIRAVWRGGVVSDDVLVQSVGELRRALGEKGAGIIRTVPRRGYRFDAEISAPAPDAILQPPPPESALRYRWPWRTGMLVLLAAVVAGGGWMMFGPHGQDGPPGIAAREKPAIAVLPFANLGGSPERQYFADGLTQDVIAALGRFSSLTVMSWGAVLPYRGDVADPGRISRNLGVQYQIVGGVQQAAGSVRVTAQLIEPTGRVLWSGSVEEPLSDAFVLQEKLTAQLAAVFALRIAHFEQQRAAVTRPGNPQAYDLVLRARSVAHNTGRAGLVEARTLIRRAIDLDPGYAAAWSALAETYLISAAGGWSEAPATQLEQAETAARRAVDLDASDVGAHIVLGRIHLLFSRYELARAEMERALAINPNDADGLAGRGDILLWLGQTDEAIQVLEAALRIKPEMTGAERFALGLAYYLKARYEAAITLMDGMTIPVKQALQLEGVVSPAIALMAACHAQAGHAELATQYAQQVLQVDPTFDAQGFGNKLRNPVDLARLRDGLAKAGLYP